MEVFDGIRDCVIEEFKNDVIIWFVVNFDVEKVFFSYFILSCYF